jgi:hypothetical protein
MWYHDSLTGWRSHRCIFCDYVANLPQERWICSSKPMKKRLKMSSLGGLCIAPGGFTFVRVHQIAIVRKPSQSGALWQHIQTGDGVILQKVTARPK